MEWKVIREGREKFVICRKGLLGVWRPIEYKPSFSLSKVFLRNLGVRKFIYEE